jgi:TonB family protein
VFALIVIPGAYGQNDRVNALAARMAEAIANSKSTTVVVFDFSSTDTRLDPLGIILADDFSLALAQADPKLHLEDRSRLKKMTTSNRLEVQNIADPGVAAWLAHDIGATSLVLGTMIRQADAVDLSVSSYEVSSGRGIALFRTDVPLTDDKNGLISDKQEPPLNEPCFSDPSLPCSGKNGYGAPRCLFCPTAEYSAEAKEYRAHGTVMLVAIINTGGRAEDIRVAKALPYGLTLAAIQAVQKWKFQPAIGPDGRPAAVRQAIEVTFNLY